MSTGQGIPGQSVMVTGAAGSLGGKLVNQLEQVEWCRRIVAVDLDSGRLAALSERSRKVVPLVADLVEGDATQLLANAGEIDAIIHFATVNRLPDSTWAQAALGFDMLARLLMTARDTSIRRFVYASSNHALGRYKEPPLVETLKPGMLTTSHFAPGTRWLTPTGEIVGYGYGAGKIFGERLCLAAARPGGLSTVAIRIGWCQEGENHPSTLDASGNPQLSGSGKARAAMRNFAGSATCGCRTTILISSSSGQSWRMRETGRCLAWWSTACPPTREWHGRSKARERRSATFRATMSGTTSEKIERARRQAG